MKPTDLLELNDDLQRESERLARLVSSVELLLPRLGEGGELVEAAAPQAKGKVGIAGFWSEWPLQPSNAQLY